jgi:hypothetical protein
MPHLRGNGRTSRNEDRKEALIVLGKTADRVVGKRLPPAIATLAGAESTGRQTQMLKMNV